MIIEPGTTHLAGFLYAEQMTMLFIEKFAHAHEDMNNFITGHIRLSVLGQYRGCALP